MPTSADRLLDLEAAVLRVGGGAYLDKIDELRTLFVLDPDKVRARIASITPGEIGDDVFDELAKAFRLGADDAARVLGLGAATVEATVQAGISTDLRLEVAGLAASSAVAVDKAKALTSAGADISAIMALLTSDANHVKRTLASATNAARNDAVVATTIATGKPMTLVAERDACVHCLAHQGVVTMTGTFPAGLTYGSKPLRAAGTQVCPIHPYCRCRMEPVNHPSFAEALRREADRSVLRGYALPSESKRARLDAADRLLDKGVTAPASVKEFARRSVKRGEFGPQTKPGSATR